MESLESVRRRGFRRWYERQLIESHAYFVTCFVCMILVASALEAFGAPDMQAQRIPMLLLACGGGALGALAWGRYRRTLDCAERLAEAAVCRGCGEYGAFRVLDWGPQRDSAPATLGESPAAAHSPWLRVRCKKCEHEWLIE